MKLVQAKILYDEILSDSAGFYAWVTPDEKAIIDITRLLRSAPCKVKDSTELHCTLIHCKENLPVELDTPKDQVIGAYIEGIDHWIDHKGRNILVLRLDSPTLCSLHEALAEQSIQHSHDEYNPHITIAKDIIWNAESRLWVDEVNQRLSHNPIEIKFSPQIKAASIT